MQRVKFGSRASTGVLGKKFRLSAIEKQHRRVSPRFLGTGAVLLSFGLISIPVDANASPKVAPASQVANSKRPVKPDFSYFSGKTITWVIGTSAGSSGDLQALAMAPLIGSYLHCTVNVQLYSNQVTGDNVGAAAAPNGLTIESLQVATIVDDDVAGIGGIDFSLKKQEILGGYPTGDSVIISNPTYALQTFQELVKSKATVPLIDEVPGGTDLQIRLLLGAYDVKIKLLTGYTSGPGELQGFIRGDAPLAAIAYSNLGTAVSSGQAKVMIEGTALLPGMTGYAYNKKDMTVAKFAAENPPKTKLGKAAINELLSIVEGPNFTMTAPAGTPAPLVAALTDAIHSAAAQPRVKNTQIAADASPVLLSPTNIRAKIDYDFAHASVITKELQTES